MRAAILYNPRAGRGKGVAVAERFVHALATRGHEARAIDVTQGSPQGTANAIEWSRAVALIGGDGTLHYSLPLLVTHPRPIFHAAMGTENLFAREFGHVPDPDLFVTTIERGRTRTIDLGFLSINGHSRPFAIMTSLGPDANIVHRLARHRAGPIRHLSYLKPILREILVEPVRPVRVWVDGRLVVDALPGMVTIANLRHYALRLDPAPDTNPADGLLDVVFLPGSSAAAVGLAILVNRVGGSMDFVRARGCVIEVEGFGLGPQTDGEAVPWEPHAHASISPTRPSSARLAASVLPHALSVFEV